ncbi:MAG: hypothetical protein HC875_30890 [Anaerolineales bacterium]|nr:hypothetical protein [Anaerolineales bacterium]
MNPGRERSRNQPACPLIPQKQDREPKPQDAVPGDQLWTKGICPNCGDTEAEVDRDGILWCCVCGYFKKKAAVSDETGAEACPQVL